MPIVTEKGKQVIQLRNEPEWEKRMTIITHAPEAQSLLIDLYEELINDFDGAEDMKNFPKLQALVKKIKSHK